MITREKLVIPTYEMEEADPSPVFYDVRNHQGTRGNVYPIPMRDVFRSEKRDREYDSVRLENDYIRVVVLPELGGRIYEGYDKKADYHFVYKNQVIKPALIGLAGAWVSGGIEFNWPQHHRPTTYMPVDCRIEKGEDGSETAWMGEYEPLFGMKGMVGVTIWPDKAYVTVRTRLYNPTNAMQTFHWWANLAVSANENYQLKFPPDIDYITYHYKDAVSPFPIVKGEFARSWFGDGTDITWFKNIPSPASFFILNSDYNFMGGYDHGRRRGTVHVADHNVSVGKKFFTWGSREFADVWHSNLTDEDGAYLEIMTGCYTDNQPDFAFLAPDETKIFEQTWYGLTELPDLKNAEKDGALGFTLSGETLSVGVNVTAEQPDACLTVCVKGEPVREETISLTPGTAYRCEAAVPAGTEEKDVSILLTDREGRTVIGYAYRKPFFEGRETPKAHCPARRPREIENQEELYLEGLQVEQYRHVTLRARDYYDEALRRDPEDIRCNDAMGQLLMKQGRPQDALPYFERAVRRSMLRNCNPRDGEPLFHYAWALELTGDEAEAARWYRKAAWNANVKAAALKQAAKLALRRGDLAEADACVKEALPCGAESLQLRFLLAYLARKTGKAKAAGEKNGETLRFDPLDYGALAETWFLSGEGEPEALLAVLNGRPLAWRTLLAQYLEIGAWQEVLALSHFAPQDLLLHFYTAYAAEKLGSAELCADQEALAAQAPLAYSFPYTDTDRAVLLSFDREGPAQGRVCYLLGCLSYGRDDRRQGIRRWQQAVVRDPELWQAHRCLALGLMDECGDLTGARREIERAFSLERSQGGAQPNGRLLLELLQIRRKSGVPVEELLELLDQFPETVNSREDLALQRLVLCNEAGRPEKTVEYLRSRIYHPYEGGEGIVVHAHILAWLQLARRALAEGNPQQAVSCCEKALEYPENYEEGRGVNAREAAVYYHMAKAQEAMGHAQDARAWLEKAANHRTGNLDESDFYTGCAMRRLGCEQEAAALYRSMLEQADQILREEDSLPYFGGFVSNLPGEHSVRIANHRRAHPAKFYALTGLGRPEEAHHEKEQAAAWGAELKWLSLIETEQEELIHESF